MKRIIILSMVSTSMYIGTAIAVVKPLPQKRQIKPVESASLKLVKITNDTPSKIKVTYESQGSRYSNTIDGKTTVTVEGTPNVSFINDINVDLTPERRYITAPAKTDLWIKLFNAKREKFKENKTGTFGVELKITGPETLELINAPLAA